MGVASKVGNDILDMRINIGDDLTKFTSNMKLLENDFAKQRQRMLEEAERNLAEMTLNKNCEANAALVSLVNSFERHSLLDSGRELSPSNTPSHQHTQGFRGAPALSNTLEASLNAQSLACVGTGAGVMAGVGGGAVQRARKLLLIGDSMIKYIDANRLMYTRKNDKLCLPGATIETIENEIVKQYKGGNNDAYTDVLVHVGTNNIPHDHPNIVINSLARLMHTVRKIFPLAEMYCSGIIPKYSNAYIIITDKINYALRNWCRVNGCHFVDTRGLFVNSKYRIRFDRLSKNDRLHLNRAGVQALAKYFTFYLNTLYGKFNAALQRQQESYYL